ncbi:alpha/beta hydrolase [soil metagenome]
MVGPTLERQDYTLVLPDGRSLGWAQYGADEGRPLLYFHGGVSSRLDIEFASDYCRDNNIKIIAPDRPGTGISSPQPKRNLLNWAEDVENLLNHLNIESLPLLGWSLGGPYVWVCAYKLPNRFNKTSTIGGASPIVPPVQIEQLGLLVDRMLFTCPPAFEPMLAASLDASGKLPPQTLRWILENELADDDKAIVQALTLSQATDFIIEATRQGGMGVVDDYRACAQPWGFEVSQIKGDVTLWYGEQDRLLPRTMTDYLKRNMPQAQVNLVLDRGHFLLHKELDKVLSHLFS